MIIRTATIRNLQAIEELSWEPPRNAVGGWHVILGDNGAGKTSFIRALALALVGPEESVAARQDWDTWLRRETDQGSVTLELQVDDVFDRLPARRHSKKPVPAMISLLRSSSKAVRITSDKISPIWDRDSRWFSAGYGPFRRFSGGDLEVERLFRSNPRVGAHITLFGENVALPETISWLQDLQYKRLEERDKPEHLLDYVETFVNQNDFLPHGVRLEEVSSRGVTFVDGNGLKVTVQELSDGYRSILSMTFDLIRQLAMVYGENDGLNLFDDTREKIVVPGIVLIDEIDVHLHPTWQKEVGYWLVKHFPNIQFVVTTHSPLVCHAASHGSIFRLPEPGSHGKGSFLEGVERDRVVLGDILEAYGTETFGSAETRSREAQEKLQRLAVLNVRELATGLNSAEKAEQRRLRAAFPTAAHNLGTSEPGR